MMDRLLCDQHSPIENPILIKERVCVDVCVLDSMKYLHEKKEHDSNFHHCEEASHDVQHDKAINIGNEIFLNSSTNDTRCM